MTHKTQVNVQIPETENLYCINCKVNPIDFQDPSPLVKSLYHSQILTCRLIIYTMRCSIASPSIQNVDDLIHVIVNKSFYNSGKFQEHISKMKVTCTNPEPVHPKIYEACLKYTFTFRLAPHWNSIGNSYYLQGFNFLSLTSNINAIEWDILFKNSNDIKLELIPIKMNLFPLTLDSLFLPPKTVDGFMLNLNINSINLTSFETPWVYVLPKLTKAKIVSVSKKLPQSCPFESYNDLRRHWKNMYSYRLPKSAQGLLFYEVVFPSKPNQYFTYPETCILSKMPEILMCDNKNEVASQFLKDLSTNVHSVCGDVIQICHLYPELDVEYSCILKKRINYENQNSQSQRSSFFKTPAEIVTKPVNERLNLSALFTFKGMDKMKPESLNHRQNVLSIMQNNRRKRKSIPENDNGNLTQSMFNSKKRKFGMSQKYLTNIPEINQEKTIVPNLDDVISYYDIPSMCSKNEESKKSDLEEHLCPHDNPIRQSQRPKPLIKNVEQVCFNLKDDHLLINSGGLKINKTETNEEGDNYLGKTKYDKTQSIPNLLNPKENEPSNLIPNECKNELPKSMHFIQDKMYHKLQSSIHTVDLNNKILSELLPKETCKRTPDEETQCYDQDIRSFLSRFDTYNMDEDDDVDMDKELYEQYKMSPTQSNKNGSVLSETLIKDTVRTSLEKSEGLENYQNNSKSTNNSLDKPEQSSSLFNLEKDCSSNVSHTYPGEILNKEKENVESNTDYLFENVCSKKSTEFGYELSPKTILHNSKTELQHKNNQQKFFETPKPSAVTHNTFEDSINRKMLQNTESSSYNKRLESKIENMNISEFGQNSISRNDQKSGREIQDASFSFGNLQNSTPPLNSIFKSSENSQILNKFNNTPQYSTDVIQSHVEVDNKNTIQHQKDINEFAEQSDFLSILSESSNESDTNDYESCKLVFNEALTLKK